MAPISFNNYRAVHHKVRGGCVFDFFFWAIDEDLLLYFHKGRGLVGDRFKKKKKQRQKSGTQDACPSWGRVIHALFVKDLHCSRQQLSKR